MSEVKRCEKCGEIVNAQDCWKGTWQLVDAEGNVYDGDDGDFCKDCKDDVNLGVTNAMNQ